MGMIMMWAKEKGRRQKTYGTNNVMRRRATSSTVLLFYLLCFVKNNGCNAFVAAPAAGALSTLPLAFSLSHRTCSTLRRMKSDDDNDNEKDDETNTKLLTYEEMKSDDDDDDNKKDDATSTKLLTYEELSQDPELFRQEQETADKRTAGLVLPERIGQAVTVSAWLFVAVGIFLNANGYGWVRQPDGWISIDTLQNRAFQNEGRKQQKSISSQPNSFLPKTMMTTLKEPRNVDYF
jgi:hypothetical protein